MSSTDNEIVHRWQSGQSLRGIARDLGISRNRVARVIREHQAARTETAADQKNGPLPPARKRRASKLDAFQDTIEQLLQRYPKITATRMLEELKKHGTVRPRSGPSMRTPRNNRIYCRCRSIITTRRKSSIAWPMRKASLFTPTTSTRFPGNWWGKRCHYE